MAWIPIPETGASRAYLHHCNGLRGGETATAINLASCGRMLKASRTWRSTVVVVWCTVRLDSAPFFPNFSR